MGRTGGPSVLCDFPFPDRLLALTLLAFEGLGTAAGKDQCLACLEEAFFPPLWAPLLALYRYHDPLWRVPDPLTPSWHPPITSVPAGLCSSPERQPWHAAWSDTGTPAPPTWGWPHASSHPPPAAPRTPPPCRTCASSRWRPVPAGSWSASVSSAGDVGQGPRGGGDTDAALCCSASPAWHLRVCRGVLRHPGRPEPRHSRHVSTGQCPSATQSTMGSVGQVWDLHLLWPAWCWGTSPCGHHG